MVGLSLAGGQTTFRETVRRTLGEEGMSTGTNAGISKACQGAWIPSTRYQPGDRDPPPMARDSRGRANTPEEGKSSLSFHCSRGTFSSSANSSSPFFSPMVLGKFLGTLG